MKELFSVIIPRQAAIPVLRIYTHPSTALWPPFHQQELDVDLEAALADLTPAQYSHVFGSSSSSPSISTLSKHIEQLELFSKLLGNYE